MAGQKFFIPGTTEEHLKSWLSDRIEAIKVCLQSSLPESALTLIYSGIDTLGFLDAQAKQRWATEASFEQWAERYILPSLTPITGATPTPLTTTDLFGARCGILHTSSSSSQLGRKGGAREIWYEFRGKSGVNLAMNTSGSPLLVNVDQFATSFQTGSAQFLVDIQADKARFNRVIDRANQIFAWGTPQS
jgi:hypothetical protein